MEDFIDVTVRTGNCSVFARQFKEGQIMIVGGWGPAGSGVTFTTSGAKAALVRVFRCMARIAVGRCALQHLINMAILAGDVDVFARQFKEGQIMIVGGWGPAGSGVAGTTIGAKPTLMGILRRVAGVAVLGGGSEVRLGAGIHMALGTLDQGMFPS